MGDEYKKAIYLSAEQIIEYMHSIYLEAISVDIKDHNRTAELLYKLYNTKSYFENVPYLYKYLYVDMQKDDYKLKSIGDNNLDIS